MYSLVEVRELEYSLKLLIATSRLSLYQQHNLSFVVHSIHLYYLIKIPVVVFLGLSPLPSFLNEFGA